MVFDFPSKVFDDEGGLHDRSGDKVFVSLVLLLKFSEQCLICGTWKAEVMTKRNSQGKLNRKKELASLNRSKQINFE